MPTPAFGTAEQIASQDLTAKLNIQAHYAANGDIWLVYEQGALIKYQIWVASTGIWGSSVDALSGFSVPSKNSGTLVSAMDDAGNIMLLWGTSANQQHWQRITNAEVRSTPAAWAVSVVGTERQWVVGRSGSKFTAVMNKPTTTGITLWDYDDVAGNWINERLEVDRSGVGGITNVQSVTGAWTDTDDTFHLAWREARGADSYIIYQKEGGSAEEVSGPHTSTASATVPKIAPSRGDDSDDVYLVFLLSLDPTGSRSRVHKRTSGSGWDAGADLDANGDGSSGPHCYADPHNNVHILYAHDATPEIYYRRVAGFGSVGPQNKVATTSGNSRAPWTPFDFVARATTFLQIIWEDDTTGSQVRAWWSLCTNCVLLPNKQFGSCIETAKGGLATDHYEVAIGQVLVWGGGPIAHPSGPGTNMVRTGAAGEIILDRSYPITANGVLTSWLFWRGTTSAVEIKVGELYLLICRDVGADVEVIGRAANSEVIPSGEGLYELSAGGIAVQKGDLVGIWMAPISNSVFAHQAPQGEQFSISRFANEALPDVGSDLPLTAATDRDVMVVGVRGAITEESIIQVGYRSDGTNDDTDSYLDFTLNTDAFADANVSTPANLFDSSIGTSSEVASGLVGNVYYHASELALDSDEDEIPVERVEIDMSNIRAGATVKIYTSNAETTNDLAGAEGVSDWVKILTIDEDWVITTSEVISVARRARWIRMEITGGSSLAQAINGFEIQAIMDRITDGKFLPNPDSGLKDRFWFDVDSAPTAPQITALLETTAPVGSTKVFLAATTPQEFFDQFLTSTYVMVVSGGRRDDNRKVSITAVFSKDADEKWLSLVIPLDESFSPGAKVLPLPKWFQLRAKDSGGALIGRTYWTPTMGVAEDWIRTHVMFTGDM